MPYKDILFFDKIDSTNTYIKDHYQELKHLQVVTSKIQTKGRGRSDHTWMSEEGNLYFSYLLKETMLHSVFTELIKISNAVTNVLRSYGINAWIKYPNDIIVENKKITGILIETKMSQDLDCLIVGVGVNVNQRNFEDLNERATSISLQTNQEYNLHQVLLDILDEYNKPHTFKEYVSKSMILGKHIRYNNEVFVVDEILEDGRLLLRGTKTIYVSPNEITLEEIYK